MKKGLVINEGVWPLIDDLLPDEKASLLTALSEYCKGNEPAEMDRIVRMVFTRIIQDKETSLSEVRSRAGKKGAKARWKKMANDGKNSINGNLPVLPVLPSDKEKVGKEKEDIIQSIYINRDIKTDKDSMAKMANNDKNGKNDVLLPPELDQDYVREALKDFKDMRQRIRKPMTKRAEELIVKDLMKLSKGDALTAKKILEQSTKNSWQGVFALKDGRASKPRMDWSAV